LTRDRSRRAAWLNGRIGEQIEHALAAPAPAISLI
jgi:hypothetical protein